MGLDYDKVDEEVEQKEGSVSKSMLDFVKLNELTDKQVTKHCIRGVRLDKHNCLSN